MSRLLEVRNLRVTAGPLAVVRGIDIDLDEGETLGLIGESGSGKTVACLSLLRLLPDGLRTEADVLIYKDRDIASLPEREFRPLRGRELAMVFQDPVGSFNPAKRIGWHLRTAIARAGHDGPWRERALELLDGVGIPQPAAVLERYPHQLSGGMLQRALIAMIVALKPSLIVADEPTTNLDNIVEEQILALFRDLQKRLAAGFIFITHDIGVAAQIADRIAVMYAGQIVETGPTADILAAPRHPYTRGLIATANALAARAETLAEIPGQLPALDALPPGCGFAPRCAQARPACAQPQPMRPVGPGHAMRCLLDA
ncbi:peptide/nickel transport system ATP-binding protein/oligopeptide transport system ATP-binding protein [Humitalea rosea]|uniref:Peptide/nickel transport system ATP-binding protein/oligopeptide transport system ATP-binding protein n=1 Tax=Humitalea rosea TaxID=990373 RepID=A0A2W7IIV6_9PROT|nr:ABC transporter ATP-binding protein [Humitalea rosea]PZW46815.1 peptide/nickel transport system ATP-binding protein/oligopeptide transport system ATP-binding protein [Humitalea rosea]